MGIPLYAHLLFKGYLCDRGAFSPSDSGERAASLCIFSTYVYPFDRQLCHDNTGKQETAGRKTKHQSDCAGSLQHISDFGICVRFDAVD